MTSIRARRLTDYEVAVDGTSCRLNFLDAEGTPGVLEFPLSCLQSLALTIPEMVIAALRAAHNNPGLRLVHNVESLRVEHQENDQSVVLTFNTPDQFTASFSVGKGGLRVLKQAFEKRARSRRGTSSRHPGSRVGAT